MNVLQYVQEARRLHATDDRVDTYIAAVLVLAALLPVLLRLYEQRSQ